MMRVRAEDSCRPMQTNAESPAGAPDRHGSAAAGGSARGPGRLDPQVVWILLDKGNNAMAVGKVPLPHHWIYAFCPTIVCRLLGICFIV